jgi:hypothetical protein
MLLRASDLEANEIWRPFGRPRHRQEDNIKEYFKEMGVRRVD